jgi:hypothetical protein
MPLAFVAALSLSSLPAQAQHRGGGGSRGGGASRGGAVSRSTPVYRGTTTVRVAPRYVASPYYYRPYYSSGYYRPYYSFRPRISLGFGLTIGYPVAYPYYYAYPAYTYGYAPSYGYRYPPDPYGYGYAPAPAYGYPPASQSSGYPSPYYPSAGYSGNPSSGSVYQVQPRTEGSINVRPGGQPSSSGGVSIEVTPGSASVFVDGIYMGTGDEFGPSSQPLGLAPGRHRIEVRANGYQTMSFEATVTAGQVVPYQASLQRKQ